MHMLRTSNWSTAVWRAMLLAGLAVVLVVALPATASASKASPSGAKGPGVPCGEDYSPVVFTSFKAKKGEPGKVIVIKGAHLRNVDKVLVAYDEDSYDTVYFEVNSDKKIVFVIPEWAVTGYIGIQDCGCSSDWSNKKLEVL